MYMKYKVEKNHFLQLKNVLQQCDETILFKRLSNWVTLLAYLILHGSSKLSPSL